MPNPVPLWTAAAEAARSTGFALVLTTRLSMAAKNWAKMAANWPMSAVCPFPLDEMLCLERPGGVKGAPLLGAAKRTLDGEDPLYTKANFRRMAHRQGPETLAAQRERVQ